MANIPNLGTAGSQLDAATTNLDYITGPAIWFPGTAGNDLTSAGFTIPSTRGILPLPYTDGALTITTEDVAALDTSAPEFTCSTGQHVVINRTTVNACTTIIPAGMNVYANPDDTAATNQAAVPTNTRFDIGLNDDVVILWAGQLGNTTTVNGHAFRSGSANTNAARLSPQTNGNLLGVLQDAAAAAYTTTITNATPVYDYRCGALVLRRATGTLTAYLYGPAGLLQKNVTDAAAATTATNVGGAQIVRNIPATVNAFAWNVGESVAPTDTQLAGLAAYMLQNAPLPTTTVYLIDPATGAYLTAPSGAFLTRR